ncbi:synaptopodin 2-like protein [Pimephales promelas]|nr:synaptopodin 2-like protein [Pimephales promelas]
MSTSGFGSAFEMPALRGKGAELFARRQSRMEKYIVDSSTVQRQYYCCSKAQIFSQEECGSGVEAKHC